MKKQTQLGMNPSTASHRLLKDILWSLIVETKKDTCFKCNLPLTRDTFSIEHKIPWLDSKNPLELFFDLNNITFSHLKCNVADARKNPTLAICGTWGAYKRGCRCLKCKEANNKQVYKYRETHIRKN